MPGMGGCEVKETGWTDGATLGIAVLQQHDMLCKTRSALRGFVLESQVPESNPDKGEIRYLHVCRESPDKGEIRYLYVGREMPMASRICDSSTRGGI